VVQEILPRELARRIANGHSVYLLDVRQPWEHETAAIEGSVLIPLGELAARAAEVKPEPGVMVVVYCHHGVRSLHAAVLLERLEHGDVLSLAGGIEAWSQEVDPTIPRY
jgi:rhodanese-related sulfurtransferase